MLQLCPRGERIKLCGRAAWLHGELVGCYRVNPRSLGTSRSVWAPPDLKISTWPGRGELIKLTGLPREHSCITLPAESRAWLTAEAKPVNSIPVVCILGPVLCLRFGISFPSPLSLLASPAIFLYTSSG